MRCALLLFLAAATCAVVHAQAPVELETPPGVPVQSEETLHVESRLVTVAVNVADAKGAPVGGLSAADFEVSEDGKPVPIAFFERNSATPLEIVVAVDTSDSTFADKKLERDAARKFVADLLRPTDRIDLMSFADAVTEDVSFTSDAHTFDEGFGHIHRGQETAMYDAIYLAAQRLQSQPASNGARRVIVVISDGENTTRHGSYDMALAEAERAGAMLYALIVVPVQADAGRNTGGEHALIQMARDTGGRYYEIYEKQDLPAAFAHLSDDLRTQYTLGYYAPHKALGNNGLRTIQVQLRNPAQASADTLTYRTAYYAR